jgi:hypothetical protein
MKRKIVNPNPKEKKLIKIKNKIQKKEAQKQLREEGRKASVRKPNRV